MTISPKSRFKQTESDVKKHASLTKDEAFHRALDYSLLSYVKKLAKANDGNLTSSAVSFHQIKGAIEFTDELLSIHEMPVLSDSKQTGLNYNS